MRLFIIRKYDNVIFIKTIWFYDLIKLAMKHEETNCMETAAHYY